MEGEAGNMEEEYKSKTQKKREDRELQRLGEALVSLPSEQLKSMDLPEELLEAIEFARKIKRHGARRRQIQHIRVIMRHIDPEPIQTALDRIRKKNPRK